MTHTITLAHAVKTSGKDVLDHLDREASIPVVTRFACQGDVAVIATAGADAGTPIPRKGVVVVASEASSNTHSLHGAGLFDRANSAGLTVGRLTVPQGAEVLLMHPEHGGMLIAPGSYEVRRQREMADELRLVAD